MASRCNARTKIHDRAEKEGAHHAFETRLRVIDFSYSLCPVAGQEPMSTFLMVG